MLSSAWHALSGRKRSSSNRDDDKKEAEEHKSSDVNSARQPSASLAALPAAATSSSASHDGPASRTRKRSKNEQQLRAASNQPAAALSVPPSSAASLSYVAPPMQRSADAASHAAAAHPEHPPPSYEDSLAHRYPVASAQQPPPAAYSAHDPSSSQQEWKDTTAKPVASAASAASAAPTAAAAASQSHSYDGDEQKHPAAPLVPLAMPPMSDQPASLSSRLADSATAALHLFASNPTIQRTQAKALALAANHVPADVQAFMREPSAGKLLLHPQLLFVVFKLYRKVKAPFVFAFKTVLLNAAKRALWNRKMNAQQLQANAHATNQAINEGLEKAIGRDFNVELSPEVCRAIVENIDLKQLKEIFEWFNTAPVQAADVAQAQGEIKGSGSKKNKK